MLGIWASREGTGGRLKRCSNMRRGCPKSQNAKDLGMGMPKTLTPGLSRNRPLQGE